MTPLPLFPLGSVLLPSEVVPLHLFEPRYLALMDDLVGTPDRPARFEPEFGVVLIERGSEVGGGDVRMATGTVARVLDSRRLPDGRWVIAIGGTRRFRIDRWLAEDPYPMAETSDILDAAWDAAGDELLAEATRLVRRTLALSAELGDDAAAVGFALADEPLVATWQLCSLAPLGPLDRQQLLQIDGPVARLRALIGLAGEIAHMLAYRLGGEQ